ncbi:4230_t:CDS:2 [Ambispora leptoticha]|uniref:4230_t:CDS:1 n=1 Tax=Ambispora leptoticha TaxID=144679 RepID=A0A9N8WNK8_9GLOM|nr:4230_t:CDS:2 [Ambispora leptoticha]
MAYNQRYPSTHQTSNPRYGFSQSYQPTAGTPQQSQPATTLLPATLNNATPYGANQLYTSPTSSNLYSGTGIGTSGSNTSGFTQTAHSGLFNASASTNYQQRQTQQQQQQRLASSQLQSAHIPYNTHQSSITSHSSPALSLQQFHTTGGSSSTTTQAPVAQHSNNMISLPTPNSSSLNNIIRQQPATQWMDPSSSSMNNFGMTAGIMPNVGLLNPLGFSNRSNNDNNTLSPYSVVGVDDSTTGISNDDLMESTISDVSSPLTTNATATTQNSITGQPTYMNMSRFSQQPQQTQQQPSTASSSNSSSTTTTPQANNQQTTTSQVTMQRHANVRRNYTTPTSSPSTMGNVGDLPATSVNNVISPKRTPNDTNNTYNSSISARNNISHTGSLNNYMTTNYASQATTANYPSQATTASAQQLQQQATPQQQLSQAQTSSHQQHASQQQTRSSFQNYTSPQISASHIQASPAQQHRGGYTHHQQHVTHSPHQQHNQHQTSSSQSHQHHIPNQHQVPQKRQVVLPGGGQQSSSSNSVDPTKSPTSQSTSLATSVVKDKKVKRPPNAFLIYSGERRPQLQKQDPNLQTASVSKKLGEEWRNMDPAEKERYNEKAHKLKEEFKSINPEYVYSRRTPSGGANIGKKRGSTSSTSKSSPVTPVAQLPNPQMSAQIVVPTPTSNIVLVMYLTSNNLIM